MKLPGIPKPNRFTIMLVTAVILAGLAAYLTIHYIQGREQEIKVKYQHKINANKVEVVVPIHNLKAGTVADGQNMAARSVPRSVIYSTTVLASEWDRFSGRVLTHDVERGRPVFSRDFSKAYHGDFAGKLPNSMRAMTIEVDGVNALSGLIRPGNRVDILLIRSGKAGSASSSSLTPLLHRILVLATGHNTMFTPVVARQQDNINSSEQGQDNYGTITLEVTPEQAAQLALAKQAGQLRIVLCPTKKPQNNDEIPALSVNELGVNNQQESASDATTVQYIIGGGGNESISSNSISNAHAGEAQATSDNPPDRTPSEIMKKAMSGLNSIIDLDKHAASLMKKG